MMAGSSRQTCGVGLAGVYAGGMDRYRDLVEEQLREAMERGEFEELPGRGRRLDLGEDSPDWWARRKMEELKRQNEVTGFLRRLEESRDRIWSLPDEPSVRSAAEDLNREIDEINPGLREEERLLPLDPDEAVATWRRMARLRPS